MAMILVYLHGKRGQALSNQLRQSRCMSPEYSIQWWADRRLEPPKIDVSTFLRQRMEWRYARGKPDYRSSDVLLGDSVEVLPRLESGAGIIDLVLTSPPYLQVTNYHYDQWLRLWVLGGPERPIWSHGPNQNKFSSRKKYEQMLEAVFRHTLRLIHPETTIYVRTDKRKVTFETTMQVLAQVFPQRVFETVDRPFLRQTQTALHGDKAAKPGEVDIISTC